MRIFRLAALSFVGLFVTIISPAGAQDFEYWPGTAYDEQVPTLENVVGHKNGERITRPGDVITYFDALAEFAPDRIKVFEYARTWENRPLIYAVIGSPENIARLDAVKDGMRALSDPRVTDEAAAAQLVDLLPGSTWIAYGVHGNEISSTDAAMVTAYHLLAAQGDATVDKILENTLVFLDPMQNPDGRARFVHNFETTLGLEPDGNRIAAERNEPWPGGRTNHYLFDMNRDWFALTQPETRGRIKALREWTPLAFVDAHEMGTDSTYYFAPEAVPYNPHLAADQRAALEWFGKNNAKWFDEYGFDYFTREVYDAFYPGYGASWPSYYGAVAMTYEQSSARGLKAQRTDGTQYHFRDTVRQHFVASIATAETVADNHDKLLQNFYAYRASAIEEGKSEEIKSYIFPATTDRVAAGKIAGLLTQQGVEVKEATQEFSACGKDYSAGAIAIDLAQPAKRLIRTLLDPNVPLDETFVAEQERLRAKDLPDQIYDVTAWSLPHMFNVEMDACSAAPDGAFRNHGPALGKPGDIKNKTAKLAFLVNWGEAPAARLLAHAHRAGLSVKSSDKPFTQDGAEYSAGTLIFPVDENPADLAAKLEGFAKTTGADVIGVDTAWVSDGPNFGSRKVVRMPAPKIAIAWDAPTNPYMAGNTRFVVERQFDYPVTPVRTSDLSHRALDQFDVLILPGESSWYGGSYNDLINKDRLKEWVNAGGVLVATGGAVRWLADPETGVLSIRREDAAKPDGEDANGEEEETSTVAGTLITSVDELKAAIAPAKESPDSSAGVLAKALVDEDHWLAAGVKPTLNVLVRGSGIYTPAKLDQGVNVAYFAGPDEVLVSGYLWEETKEQLAYKPFVVAEPMGDGHVIAFTQDPTVRAYLDGLNMIFMNALFRAPAHASPAR